MSIKSFLFPAGVASLLAVLLFSLSAQASPLPDDPAEGKITGLADLDRMPTAEVFRLAYDVLGPGKRNYLGHRGGAMAEIEAAAKLLGVDIGRKIQRAHDDQPKSDARLDLARKILLRVRERLATEDQTAVLEHVDKALAEIDKGLKIRAVEDEK